VTSGSSESASGTAAASSRDSRESAAGESGPGSARTREAETQTATAVVLATAPAAEGGPAAALPWAGATVVRRLLGQLADLGVHRVHVVTRPGWEAELAPALEGLDPAARVHVCAVVADDLRAVTDAAREGSGPLLVLHGEIVTHREALAGLLAGPRLVTGVLARSGGFPPFLAPRTRSARGRIVSASSAYHSTAPSNTSLLGVVKVGARDRPTLIETGERLAALTEGTLPPGWEEELERKAARWRLGLASGGVGADAADEADDPVNADGREPPDATDEDERAATGLAADEDESGPERYEAGEARIAVSSPEADAEVERRLAVLREDAVALLVVGLVRAGTPVANSFLRALFWARPLSRDAARDTAERIEDYDEDRALLDSAVKGNDGFFTTFFVSPYSKYIARWAARRGLTPNQVTTVSMAIGVAAAVAFATGSRPGLIVGAVLLQAAFTADCVDGQLARYTRTFSKFGAWLDSIFDRSKEYVVFAGLAIGASRGFGEDVWVLATAALTLQTLRHMFDFSFGATQHEAIETTPRMAVEEPGDRPARRPGMPPALATSPGRDGATGSPAAPSPSPLLDTEPGPPAEPAVPLPRRVVRAISRRATRLSRTLERRPATRWLKKILVFPIGERFAVISLTAALATPRVTFVVVLALGGVATLYALTGRTIRALSR